MTNKPKTKKGRNKLPLLEKKSQIMPCIVNSKIYEVAPLKLSHEAKVKWFKDKIETNIDKILEILQ
jgi:hypothetical protein